MTSYKESSYVIVVNWICINGEDDWLFDLWSGILVSFRLVRLLGVLFIGYKMNGAALVALAATIGNFLQGWDNATIAGTVHLYIWNLL